MDEENMGEGGLGRPQRLWATGKSGNRELAQAKGNSGRSARRGDNLRGKMIESREGGNSREQVRFCRLPLLEAANKLDEAAHADARWTFGDERLVLVDPGNAGDVEVNPRFVLDELS